LLSVAKKVSAEYPYADLIVRQIVDITRIAGREEAKRDNYYLWHLLAETLAALPAEPGAIIATKLADPQTEIVFRRRHDRNDKRPPAE